ncbi:hypothetical protein [Clostridium sp. AM58-1XD]|uniref:N-acetylmuramoyl-L-alanine amidase family protein n=1 Tax=Clostridium sp. AM58-1XD TaxID=2292307 RepID=UPI000E4F6438|nr:hypothetical protein [Clostridium sp. AM58-1XD]RGZ00422.1 hypothetical protein DXA13_05120 [Clostridium sp. AM58-1XD]
MNQWKKASAVLLAAVLTAGAAMTALAASNKKITSVSLTITSEIKVGDDMSNDSIEVDADSNKYTVDSWEILNPGFEWMEEDVPQIKIYLTAEDGYYFSLTSSKVKLKGATYVTASKKDSSTMLMITADLPSLAETVEDIEKVTLGEDGVAYWDPVIGAGSYELRILRDGKITGPVINVTNGSCNVRTYLGKAGTYYVRVRPVNRVKTDVKGDWVESGVLYVDSDRAIAFRTGQVASGGQWEQNGDIWKYRDTDGSYPVSSWKLIGDKWYYFDSNGIMQTGWIQIGDNWYYCDETGAMLHDTTIEQYRLGSDGAMITE